MSDMSMKNISSDDTPEPCGVVSGLYDMRMHESIEVDDSKTVIRVPGGWIYEFTFYSGPEGARSISTSFVPFPSGAMINKEIPKISANEAMDVIRKEMLEDDPSKRGSYAHSWHCNIAMSVNDAIENKLYDHPSYSLFKDKIHEISNEAASNFMKMCFGAVTRA